MSIVSGSLLTKKAVPTITLNTGLGEAGNWVALEQRAAGQVSVGGNATINASIGPRTRAQNSVITLLCVAADTWLVSGDQGS